MLANRFTDLCLDRPTYVRWRSITLLDTRAVCLANPSVTMQTYARVDGTGHPYVHIYFVRSRRAAENVDIPTNEFRALSITYDNEFITRKSVEKD